MCSRCLKKYAIREFLALPHVPAVDDTDPKRNYGYLPVCTCGSVFIRDKWRMDAHLTLADHRVCVSTISLELNHGFGLGEDQWYETIIFLEESVASLGPQWRYRTQEEAERAHTEIVKNLQAGRYKFSWEDYGGAEKHLNLEVELLRA